MGCQKKEVDVDLAKTIGEWLDNPPEYYGFVGETGRFDMPNRERGISFRMFKLQRMLKQMGFSYTKARPISAKSAAPEEQLEFTNKTNKEIVSGLLRDTLHSSKTRQEFYCGTVADTARGAPVLATQ